jgi:hypothetical protein
LGFVKISEELIKFEYPPSFNEVACRVRLLLDVAEDACEALVPSRFDTSMPVKNDSLCAHAN